MSNLDEVLNRDTDGKINWLVAEVSEVKSDVNTIKNNHLFHIEKDMNLLKRWIYGLTAFVITALTGIKVM